MQPRLLTCNLAIDNNSSQRAMPMNLHTVQASPTRITLPAMPFAYTPVYFSLTASAKSLSKLASASLAMS